MVKACLLLVCMIGGASCDHGSVREKIINAEKTTALGGSIVLSAKEEEVNKFLFKFKNNELQLGIENSTHFLPRLHFFESKRLIETSDVFKFIQRVPKGASLHTHITAAVSIDYLFNKIIEAENLYANHINGQYKLKYFGRDNPALAEGWVLLSELRKNETYDEYLRSQLTLEVSNPREVYPTIEVAWKKFMSTFSVTYDMYAYRPFFEEVVYRTLEELVADNVFYVEFRAAVVSFYDLNSTRYPPSEFCRSLEATFSRFKTANPKFIGARIILAPSRRMENEAMQDAINVFKSLKAEFPDLIAGFDLIGFEEMGRPLLDLVPLLEPLKNETKFFFHAGETNWFGTSSDLNLLDAVLLGSTRIGHAFSLTKHPEILKYVKSNNTAIEITPISNQVLMLVEDFRNHPATSLMSQGLPVVICNDDPTFWGASGLSYDWYLAFMGMSSMNSGLGFLKQLAINSISYSAMNESEKERALSSWDEEWNEFVYNLLIDNNLV